MKRLPPYANQATQHPDRDVIGYFIYAGAEAWATARASAFPAMALPDGERPESFRWPVAGLAATIIRTSPVDAEIQVRLGRELIKAGANPVCALWNGPYVLFQPEINRAA